MAEWQRFQPPQHLKETDIEVAGSFAFSLRVGLDALPDLSRTTKNAHSLDHHVVRSASLHLSINRPGQVSTNRTHHRDIHGLREDNVEPSRAWTSPSFSTGNRCLLTNTTDSLSARSIFRHQTRNEGALNV